MGSYLQEYLDEEHVDELCSNCGDDSNRGAEIWEPQPHGLPDLALCRDCRDRIGEDQAGCNAGL